MRQPEIPVDFKVLSVASRAFKQGGHIPKRYTCDGENVHPPLTIGDMPPDAKCLVLIVEDPDAPGGTFVHWVSWNIPITHLIDEGELPGEHGTNDFGDIYYGGPCPPSGLHRYFFKVYALNQLIDLPKGSTKQDVDHAMHEHILAYGELMGIYKRAE